MKAQQSEFIEGVAGRIAPNGCAVVSAAGEHFTVAGAARGERILCRRDPARKDYAELVEFITVSPRRIDPCCPYYGVCGGCSLRHIDYEAQIEEKLELLHTSFLHIASIDQLPDITVHRSAPDGYRDRAQFHRVKQNPRGGGRKTILPSTPQSTAGFMARSGETVVPVTDCLVLNDTLRAALREGRLAAPLDKDRWSVYGREGQILSEGGTARGRFSFNAHGQREELMLDAGIFFQSNGVLLEQLVDWLLDAAEGERGRAGDFYAGTGVFTAFLRRCFEKIDLLEENRAALALARENLMAHTPEADRRYRFFGVSDTVWVKNYGKRTAPYHFICADPGRRGLSGAMLRWLCETPPKTLAYISCEYQALARDTRQLVRAGFNLQSLDFFDFYPQTPRLELAALFRYN